MAICAAVILMGLVCIAGCLKRYDPTVWREESRSPDGAWVATAHTEQYGGFGTAEVDTSVDLQRSDKTYNRGKPFNILGLEPAGIIPATYQLSPANRGGGADLQVRWIGPRTLELSYDGKSKVNLLVVRFGDVSVRLVDASGVPVTY